MTSKARKKSNPTLTKILAIFGFVINAFLIGMGAMLFYWASQFTSIPLAIFGVVVMVAGVSGEAINARQFVKATKETK